MRLVAIIVFLFSMSTHAATLGPNDIYISGELVSVTPMCPAGATCMVNGTHLNFRFMLPNSCFAISELGYQVSGGSKTIQVTTVQSDNSDKGHCSASPAEELRTVSLVNVFPPLQVYFTGDAKLSFPTDVQEYSR